MKELVAAGQAHGVPIAAVLTPSRILASEHFQAVGAITNAELVPGVHTDVPTGYFVVDDERCGFRTPAPSAGHDQPRWLANPVALPAPTPGHLGDYPFAGLRILDLGVIVAGGELSRLFGDMGAEVIKVESADYPDGLRQSRVGAVMSESFAWTHRNHLALGLDLRNTEGKEIFGRLVADADAVFANFKPGTLTALGFSFDALRTLNPRIVLAGSSAFGNRGPWSRRMGYGPLVRAATGVTRLWTSDEAVEETPAAGSRHAFYDATTIFPDHVVGRVTALVALAALIRRDRTGEAAHVHISQAEVVVNQLDTLYVEEAARAAGAGEIRDDTSVHSVYPCAGDDEWCVISIRSDGDWRCAAVVFGHPAEDPRFATGAARVANRRELGRAGVGLDPQPQPHPGRARVAIGGDSRGADEQAGGRPGGSAADRAERVQRHDASTDRPPPARGNGSGTLPPHPARTAASGAAARSGHPGDLPRRARNERRADRPADRRSRAVHLAPRADVKAPKIGRNWVLLRLLGKPR